MPKRSWAIQSIGVSVGNKDSPVEVDEPDIPRNGSHRLCVLWFLYPSSQLGNEPEGRSSSTFSQTSCSSYHCLAWEVYGQYKLIAHRA